jgi:hypothetical protein
VIAYKFLRPDRVAPFTGVRWQQGVWVEASGAAACALGVHACRREDLPYWLRAELWEIELDGEIVEAERKLVATRGRLVRQVERWDRGAWTELGRSCVRRVRELPAGDPVVPRIAADMETVLSRGDLALVPYFASVAAGRAGGDAARLAERRAQADWLAEHVVDTRKRRLRLRRMR